MPTLTVVHGKKYTGILVDVKPQVLLYPRWFVFMKPTVQYINKDTN